MTEKIFIYGFVALAVGLAIGYLNRGTKSQVVSDNGQYFLRMNKFYGAISILSIFLGLLIAIMIIVTDEPLIVAIITLFIFLGLGIPLFLLYKNHYLKFNNELIEVKNYLGSLKSIQWIDVQDVSFNHFSSLLTISDKQGNKIKIHQHIVGFATFIKTMEDKTNWTAVQLRLPH